MKTFMTFFKEDSAVDSVPAGQQGQQKDPLKNPSLMHNSQDDAFNAAKRLEQNSAGYDPGERAYILKYKYYANEHVKQFVVINNKTLLSQAPDWEQRGYLIIGWVSPTDGVVIRTQDGKYVKDTGQ